jgi:hypothetical protein
MADMLDPENRDQRVHDLLDRIENGPSLDWRAVREEIHDLFGQVATAERVTLLRIFTAVMDTVERQGFKGRPDDLAIFRETRRKGYNLLLAMETVVEGNVSPDLLDMVTAREVAAGRMSPDDNMRKLAVSAITTMGRELYSKDAPRGLLAKIRSWPSSGTDGTKLQRMWNTSWMG